MKYNTENPRYKPKWLEHYTEEEFKEILANRDRWDELEDIYSDPSILKWARRFDVDIQRQGKPSKFDDVPREQWVEWIWEDGYTMQEMADSWDVSMGSVCYQIQVKHKIPYPEEKWEIYFTEEELKALLVKRRAGYDRINQEIRDGISYGTFLKWRKKYVPNWRESIRAEERPSQSHQD